MNLSPSDTLEDVINRYPLTVEYFVDAGYTDQWRITLRQFVQREDTSIRQLEGELNDHLAVIVRPEPDDCKAISCDPLPFCPEEVEIIGIHQIFRSLEWVLRLPGTLFGRTDSSHR